MVRMYSMKEEYIFNKKERKSNQKNLQRHVCGKGLTRKRSDKRYGKEIREGQGDRNQNLKYSNMYESIKEQFQHRYF